MKATLTGGMLVIVVACLSACASVNAPVDPPVTGESLVPAGEQPAVPTVPKSRGPMPRGGMMDDELNYGKTY